MIVIIYYSSQIILNIAFHYNNRFVLLAEFFILFATEKENKYVLLHKEKKGQARRKERNVKSATKNCNRYCKYN